MELVTQIYMVKGGKKKKNKNTKCGAVASCQALTVDGRDDDGPHEGRVLGVGALPVQGDSARADFPRAAVDGVEGVPRADGVHHCPVFPVVGVHR